MSQCLGPQNNGGFWTAGHVPDPAPVETTFVWKVPTSNGYVQQTMEYTYWFSDEPNSYPSEACVAAMTAFHWWIDAGCSSGFCYLCEYETVMPFGYTGPGDTCSGDAAIPAVYSGPADEDCIVVTLCVTSLLSYGSLSCGSLA